VLTRHLETNHLCCTFHGRVNCEGGLYETRTSIVPSVANEYYCRHTCKVSTIQIIVELSRLLLQSYSCQLRIGERIWPRHSTELLRQQSFPHQKPLYRIFPGIPRLCKGLMSLFVTTSCLNCSLCLSMRPRRLLLAQQRPAW
jgi:hypothetical protein